MSVPSPSNRALRRRLRRPAGAAAVLAAVAVTAVAAAPAALGAPAPAPAAPAATPPPVTVLTDTGDLGQGDIFVSPFGASAPYSNGAEILNQRNQVVWFHPVPAGQEAADFRVQRYDGQPVLTWWQGTGLGGVSTGTDYIYNSHYQQIAAVNAGNGLSADGHEFLITPWNTALILSYTTATANLTSIGGPSDQTVIDGVVQEIDIKTGKVLFQWNSADHVPYSQSEQALPASASSAWDWFHINAVKVDGNGDILIDARDTWTTYKVSLRSGRILWQLGGKDSSFRLRAAPGQSLNQAGDIFAWQHDPEPVGPNELTFFDNESAGVANTGAGSTSELGLSRIDRVKLDPLTHTATLVQTYDQPAGLTATSQGNGQTTANGDVFVGWGDLPYISEFSPGGRLLFNAEFPTGVNTYRAYLFPWPQGQASWTRRSHHGREARR